MSHELNQVLQLLAVKNISETGPSHDMQHALRVQKLCLYIAQKEGGDTDILTAAALFHDSVNYPKNIKKRLQSSNDSARLARKLLKNEPLFPQNKVEKVVDAITTCSFTKNLKPNSLEGEILQDADALESVGAIAIMRTFASAGELNIRFYNPEDPFCKKRQPDDQSNAIDLFYTRLLIIAERLHTTTAKQLAKNRIEFLNTFLLQLEHEILFTK